MKRLFFCRLAAFALALAAAAPAAAQPVEIAWEDLMPPGEEERLAQTYEDYFAELERKYILGDQRRLLDMMNPMLIAEGSELDQMPQLGTFNVAPELDGKEVRIPTYIVPFDFNDRDEYQEFLLVPYFGACIHTPPPPPNQIIHVALDKPMKIRDIWAPFWAEGVLSAGRHENDLGDAAYSLQLTKLEPYEFPSN